MTDQEHFAAALLNQELPHPSGLRVWDGANPAARFAVYRNNVMVSLIDALRDGYPVTEQLVGEAFFAEMARAYARSTPPSSPILTGFGHAFASFVAHYPGVRGLAYLGDVAQLEWARICVYHAADCAHVDPGSLAQLLAMPERLPAVRLALHPALHLVRSHYPVVSVWEAHQHARSQLDAMLNQIDMHCAESALLYRAGMDVCMVRLDKSASTFMADLMQGTALGIALESVLIDQPGFNLAATLRLLIENQLITGISWQGALSW